jgi:hypothetical protein
MPPPMDFNVMAKRSLGSWDDDELTLTSEIFLPGQFQARVPIANGYVWFLERGFWSLCRVGRLLFSMSDVQFLAKGF